MDEDPDGRLWGKHLLDRCAREIRANDLGNVLACHRPATCAPLAQANPMTESVTFERERRVTVRKCVHVRSGG